MLKINSYQRIFFIPVSKGVYSKNLPCIYFEPSVRRDHINTRRFEGELAGKDQLPMI